MQRKIIAVVGLAGAGKTEAVRFLESYGLISVRFGDITEKLLRDNHLEQNEANERRMREYLRQKEGMEAYAKLSLAEIRRHLEVNHVVIDGLYSWEEYLFLKQHYGEYLILLAVIAPPPVRHLRLNTRIHRPLSREEAIERDISEIENLNKGGPIVIADHTIVNVHALEDLRKEIEKFVKGHL